MRGDTLGGEVVHEDELAESRRIVVFLEVVCWFGCCRRASLACSKFLIIILEEREKRDEEERGGNRGRGGEKEILPQS